jgi:ABC-2 type transport system permease protein
VIALFVAAQAPVAVSRDLRFVTMPLYFSRPITARDYVRAKFGAMFCSVLVLTALPMLIMWIGTLLASMGFAYNLKHFGFGLVAAGLYSLLYAAIATAIASLTPRRGFGVAAIIAVMLISTAVSGIVYAVLNHAGHFSSDAWANMISPARLVDSTVNWMFNLATAQGDRAPSAIGGWVFLAEILVLSAAAYGLLVRRYRKL